MKENGGDKVNRFDWLLSVVVMVALAAFYIYGAYEVGKRSGKLDCDCTASDRADYRVNYQSCQAFVQVQNEIISCVGEKYGWNDTCIGGKGE